MGYSARNIRNICLLGHGGSGKTSLAESILFLTGGTDRLGKIADGNTVSDSDPEETKRQISLSLTVEPVEYGKCKINLLDAPGYFDFTGEVMEALQVADGGLIVCPAKGGVGVGAEKAWKYLRERNKPCAFYISKTDEENGDYNAVFDALREKFGNSICPVIAPIWDADKRVVGVIDVVHRKAYDHQNGKSREIPVPPEKESVLDELYGKLMESVAETSEEYMEKYFAGEAFTEEEVAHGLQSGMRDLTLVPVFCGSAFTGLGTTPLLDGIVSLFPSPDQMSPAVGTDSGDREVAVSMDPAGPVCAYIFKTTSDQYGKFSYFKVLAGSVTPELTMVNARTGGSEKIGHIYTMKGRKGTEVREIACGDIGAAAKLNESRTGDTLCDPKRVVTLPPIPFPEPCYAMAILPKTKGQEEKISSGLQRLGEEDLTFTVTNNAETRQMVVTGAGDIQLDVLCSKLKSRFGVEAELQPVRVAYREKIRKKVKVQGRHKKQSGGHGQFGDVWIEFEPGDTEELVFTENIFGGSVPKNFHPAVEKGLRESAQHGVLAGYPVVFLKATLVDGSYHPVDSSEMAFKTAAALAYRTGLPQASPVLLEPIGMLKVTVPDSYMGDIIGDLNKRRGRVLGMTPTGTGDQAVEAEVPMAEMGSYAIDLRSMTQGRGAFIFRFTRYEETPPNVQQKAIEDAKAFMEQGE